MARQPNIQVAARSSARRAEARIQRLRRGRPAPACGRENLDGPLDGDIVVEKHQGRSKMLLMLKDQPVSSTNIIHVWQNFGSCKLRVGGIAGVSTPPEHRFRGYSRRVMHNALRWMRREGFDMALLFGIRGFYPKFGFAPVLPAVKFTMPLREAETVRPTGLKLVAFGPQHLKAVLGMYHRNNLTRTGPIRRAPRTWTPFRKGLYWRGRAVCKVALDGGGRPVGYYVYDDLEKGSTVIEVGFATPAVFGDILAAAARLSWRRRCETLEFHLPEDHPLIAYCRPLELVKEVHYHRDGGAMARMVNVGGALEKLAPMLAERAGGAGRITIRTNLDGATLAWSRGRMKVCPPQRSGLRARLPQWALAQLLYGHRDAASLAANGALHASGKAVETMARLFPPGTNYFYAVDMF